jgi:DNA-binding LacI/PurR family transcriptional regulator
MNEQGEPPTSGPERVPKLDDVALLAGVSKSTASRALSGRRPVSPDIATRVHDAARRLSYAPHMGARSLRRAESMTIGIVYHNLDNPGHRELLQGLGAASDERGYSLLVMDASGSDERYLKLVQRLFERRVDGLVLDSPGDLGALRDQYRAARIPIVALYRKHPANDGIPVFSGTERLAVGFAARRLVSLGHRQIGYLSSVPATRRRAEVLAEAFAQCDPAAIVRPAFVDEPQDDRIVRALTDDLLLGPERITALFVDHRSVPYVVQELARVRIEVPSELSMISFSESRWSHAFTPNLGTIKVDVEGLGRALAQGLVDWILGDPPPEVTRTHEAIFLERGSVARAPGFAPPVRGAGPALRS